MKVMKWSPWQATQWSHNLARGGDGQLQCNCQPCSATKYNTHTVIIIMHASSIIILFNSHRITL